MNGMLWHRACKAEATRCTTQSTTGSSIEVLRGRQNSRFAEGRPTQDSVCQEREPVHPCGTQEKRREDEPNHVAAE